MINLYRDQKEFFASVTEDIVNDWLPFQLAINGFGQIVIDSTHLTCGLVEIDGLDALKDGTEKNFKRSLNLLIKILEVEFSAVMCVTTEETLYEEIEEELMSLGFIKTFEFYNENSGLYNKIWAKEIND